MHCRVANELSVFTQSTLTTISSWLFLPDARSWFLHQVSPKKPHLKQSHSNALPHVCLVGFVQGTLIFSALIFMFFLPHRQKDSKVVIQLNSAEMLL